MSKLHLRAETLGRGGDPVALPPERAGWRYTGLEVIRLAAGERRTIGAGGRELLVLPLSGGCEVTLDGGRYSLEGRRDVFERGSDFVYAPADCRIEIEAGAGGAELALPWAVAERRFPPAYVSAGARAPEIRGAGRATRLIRNLFLDGGPPAQRLAVVEVLTPPGNWSSYPPHKHDDAASGLEDELEEIYYFRIAGEHGFGLHRTYTADGELDETVAVRDGDVFLVPRGYHGPCVAPPEFPMYYLNVLAGAAGARSLRYRDDPAYGWIRERWGDEAPDPRAEALFAAGAATATSGGAS